MQLEKGQSQDSTLSLSSTKACAFNSRPPKVANGFSWGFKKTMSDLSAIFKT